VSSTLLQRGQQDDSLEPMLPADAMVFHPGSNEVLLGSGHRPRRDQRRFTSASRLKIKRPAQAQAQRQHLRAGLDTEDTEGGGIQGLELIDRT
jgi:hypothetical protein